MNFLISIFIAALSGMGVGGGGLFALYLKMFSDYPQLQIQAFNLVFFLFASSSALLFHICNKRVYFLPVCIMILGGIAGSLLGSSLALRVQSDWLSRLFGALLIFTGIYTFFNKRGKRQKK